jgi:hypothetical protein
MSGDKATKSIKKQKAPIIENTKDDSILNEITAINIALSTWETEVSPERKNKVKSMIEK